MTVLIPLDFQSTKLDLQYHQQWLILIQTDTNTDNSSDTDTDTDSLPILPWQRRWVNYLL